MRRSLFAVALLATVAACSAPSETTETADAAESSEAATAEVTLLADLGGEPQGPVYTKTRGETLAVSGYDTVSYFQGDGVPVEGSVDYTVRYQGYDYRFASQENAAEPAKYAPAYGGYCAWAIGENDALAEGNPNVYKIVDGKLYLNFNEGVQDRWEVDIPRFITKGDANYPTHSPDEHYQG